MRDRIYRYLKNIAPGEIQSMIMIVFSVISVSIVLCVGIVMYLRFSTVSREDTIENTQKLVEQTGESLEDYLVNMRQVSDTAYYNIIKGNDFSGKQAELQKEMNLLYQANKENLRSIAIYDSKGRLMAAEPVVSEKEGTDVTEQEWFWQAVEEVENIHFSTPHVQNLFDDGSFRYYWVISSSRVVELVNGSDSDRGVLLVDMDYSSVSRMMNQMNKADNGQYYYLCDNSGEIIYHPRQAQINNGLGSENSYFVSTLKDGVYDEEFEGEDRKIIVNTISYTGWKLVGVIPPESFSYKMIDIQQFIAMFLLLIAMMLILVNRVVSARISSPILKLNQSVMEYETGENPEIYIGGSLEIRHLGESIQNSYQRNAALMQKVVVEQNERRKSELDALQSQINPHFLYNALDSITWMIEGERNDDAAFTVTQLAKLFRISLSKGHTVISVKDEIQHAKSYMNIQKIRYKDAFTVVFDIEPEVFNYCAVKLTLQPLLENAINYGIIRGEDEDGEIRVMGRMEEGNVVLAVQDNGIGIPEEEVEFLLTDSNRVRKQGSGVGLVNVNNRIQILFGKQYGLKIESEPDEGTTVSICIPAVLYNEKNRGILEKGYQFSKEEIEDRK